MAIYFNCESPPWHIYNVVDRRLAELFLRILPYIKESKNNDALSFNPIKNSSLTCKLKTSDCILFNWPHFRKLFKHLKKLVSLLCKFIGGFLPPL